MEKPDEHRGGEWAAYVWWRVNRWAKRHKLDNKVSSLGIYNCRKIAGSSTWSQHSWGNALDIGVKDKATGDKVVKFLHRQLRHTEQYRFNIEHCLWWVENHYDHVHIDFSPNYTGTPPCAK